MTDTRFAFNALSDTLRALDNRVKKLERTVASGEIQSWGPILSSTGTAPYMQDALAVGRYVRIGQLQIAWFAFTFGAMFTPGTGFYTVSLPFQTENVNDWDHYGNWATQDADLFADENGYLAPATTTTLYFRGSSNAVSATWPWVPEPSDRYTGHIVAPIAPGY